jgi:hypothetical protein
MKHFEWSARILTAGIALAGTTSVWSQSVSPYTLGVYETISYQPNVYQAANGDSRTSDVISSTGVNFGIAQALDGFSVFANGNVQANVYQDTKSLNNPSFGVNLGASSTTERLGGTIRYSASQSLGDYGTPGVTATTERNLQTNQEAGLALRYRLTPRTNLVAGIGWQSLAYSASAFDAQESSSEVATLDLTHQLTPEFRAGFGARYSNGSTPKYATGSTPGSFIADRFDSQYIDLLFSWQPGHENTIRGRVSYSRVNHTEATQLDYTGPTGSIVWTYTPNSRLALSSSLTQNTGSGPNLLGSPLTASTTSGGASAGGTGSGSGTATSNDAGSGTAAGSGGSAAGSGTAAAGGSTAGGVALTSDNNRLNTAIAFAATYQATRTISVNGNVTFNYGDLVNASADTGNALTTTIGLGFNYLPTRTITLGCSISTTIQNASQDATSSNLAYSYRSPTIGCTGALSFF